MLAGFRQEHIHLGDHSASASRHLAVRNHLRAGNNGNDTDWYGLWSSFGPRSGRPGGPEDKFEERPFALSRAEGKGATDLLTTRTSFCGRNFMYQLPPESVA